jgi:hypothetical protein
MAADEAEIFRGIVGAMPHDFFNTCPFLVRCLTAHIANAKTLAVALAEIRSTKDWRKRFAEFNKLAALHARESTAIVNLSTKLRLTPRSKFTTERTSNILSHTSNTPKPWEIRKEDGDPAA